jgi:protein-tyrosine-phosphatase
MARPKVLFISPGTGARSVIAKAFARYYAGQEIEVESACPTPKPPSAHIIWAMNEVAIDISDDHPVSLKSVNLDEYDYVATISDRGEIPLPALTSKTRVEHWTVADTAKVRGQTPDVIRSIRVIRYLIEANVQALLHKALATA